MSDWITYADRLRDTLEKLGPLTRAELADKTNLPRETLAKSLYVLKKQGDVIEEGDRLILAKAPETAQDAPEEAETGEGSAQGEECGTGQNESIPDTPTFCGLASDDRIQDAVQKMMDTIPRHDTRPKSPDELPELASSSLNALIADYRRVIDEWRLMKLQVEDNKSLWEDMQQLRETNNRLLADSLAYIALKEKLRGMLDAD